MLECGDNLQVSVDGGVSVSFPTNEPALRITCDDDHPLFITSTDDNYDFLWLSGKKPYFINITYIECVVGEWNKDRTQYGVWTADGANVLKKLYGEDAAKFFKEVAAKGAD